MISQPRKREPKSLQLGVRRYFSRAYLEKGLFYSTLEGHKHYPLSFRRLIFQKNTPQIAPVWVKSRLIEGMGVEVVLFSCCNFGAVIWGIEIYFNKSCGSELNPKINAWNTSQSGTIFLRRSGQSEMQVPNTWLFSTSCDCLDNMLVLSGFGECLSGTLWSVVIYKVNIFSKVDVIDSCQMFLSTYQWRKQGMGFL